MCEKPSCLGEPWCREWGCCSDTDMEEPPKKRARVDHASPPVKSVTRFPAPTGSPTMNHICKGYVPKNTDKATAWALRVFNAWRSERNCVASDKCPEDLLERPDVGNLNRWLARFVVECRRENGMPYPSFLGNQYSRGTLPLLQELWRSWFVPEFYE